MNTTTNRNPICRDIAGFLPNSALQAFPQSLSHPWPCHVPCVVMKRGLQLPSPTRGKPPTRAAPQVTSAAVNEKGGPRDQDPSRSQPFQAEINYNICIN